MRIGTVIGVTVLALGIGLACLLFAGLGLAAAALWPKGGIGTTIKTVSRSDLTPGKTHSFGKTLIQGGYVEVINEGPCVIVARFAATATQPQIAYTLQPGTHAALAVEDRKDLDICIIGEAQTSVRVTSSNREKHMTRGPVIQSHVQPVVESGPIGQPNPPALPAIPVPPAVPAPPPVFVPPPVSAPPPVPSVPPVPLPSI